MEQLEKHFKLARWIAEDLTNVISDADKVELEHWLADSDQNRLTYRELKDAFSSGDYKWPYSDSEVQQHLKKFHACRSKKRRVMRSWHRYVAVLILFIGLIAIVRWQTGGDGTVKQMPPSIQVAKGNVKLILSTGKEVYLTDTLRQVQDEPTVNIRVAGQGILYDRDSVDKVEEVSNRLVVPRGGEYYVQLSDGTCVWLNAQSELNYPVNFTGNERVVYLKGEGYFEVAPDANKPFIVRTDEDVAVRVLGTKFNLYAYGNDSDVVTTLAEGSVEVLLPGKTVKIMPDEQIIYNKKENSYAREQVDASVYSSWKDGNFIFENQPLEKIMERLKRWYEMEIFYTNNDVRKYRFTGDLKKYDDFEKVVRMLEEVAGVKIEINDKRVIIGTK